MIANKCVNVLSTLNCEDIFNVIFYEQIFFLKSAKFIKSGKWKDTER